VYAVAIVAGRGVEVAVLNGAAVHALLISFHRQRDREHVLGGKGRVGMALAAGVGQVRFAHRRFRVG